MQYPGKAPPEFIETHRLPPEALSREAGLIPLDPATLGVLRALRERRPPRDRVRFTLSLAAALFFHLLLALVISYEMQPRVQLAFAVPDDTPQALEVRFIEPAPRAPAAPAIAPPPVAEPPPRVRSNEATRAEPPPPQKKLERKDPAEVGSSTATPSPSVPAARPGTAAPAHTAAPVDGAHPALFNTDGTVAMPATGPGSAKSDYTPPHPTDDTGIMSHKTTITVTQTRFEKDWAPRDENVLSKGMRRAIETTTVKKTVDLGHGTRVNCATVFFVIPVGCGGEDPSKASKKDGDKRLSMPATPLVKDLPDQPPAKSEAECIAAYRKDERVADGCPTDTPLKAMDQENAERTRRTGN